MHFRGGLVAFLLLSSTALAQDYTVTPLSIRKCVVLDGEELDYQLWLNEESDGGKSLSYRANLTQVLDEECWYKVYVDVMSGPRYVRYMQGDGKVCDALGKLIKPAWEEFKLSTNPPIKESCTLNPNSYSLDSFRVKKEDVNIPIPSKGKFRAELHLFCHDVKRACVVGEILVTEDD